MRDEYPYNWPKHTCPVHGTWVFVERGEEFQKHAAAHADCKWPVSTRRFPAKSRKRVAL